MTVVPTDLVLMSKASRRDPLIGYGLGGCRPLNPSKKTYTRGVAWLDLNLATWCKQIIPGLGHNEQSLDIADTFAWAPDVSSDWNWHPKDTKKWIGELRERQLITQRLFDEIVKSLPGSKWERDQLPKKTRAAVLAKTSGRCVYCATELTERPGKMNSFHADHVLAVTRGGTDDIANLVPSCLACNTRKGTKTIAELCGWAANVDETGEDS